MFDELRDRLTHFAPPIAAFSRALCAVTQASDMPFFLPFAQPSQMIEAARTSGMAGRPARFKFASEYGEISAVVDIRPFPALESIALDPDPKLRIALANLWLNATLAPTRAAGLENLHITDLTPLDTDAQAHGTGLPIAWGEDESPLDCVITALPTALVEVFAQQTQDSLPVERYARFGKVRATGRLLLAARTCRLSLLSSVQLGDVLLGWNVPQPYHPGDALEGVQISWGTTRGTCLVATATIEGHQIIITHGPIMSNEEIDHQFTEQEPESESHQDQDQEEQDNAQDLAELEDIELPVQLELNTLDLSLSTLATLQPGYLLELPIPIDDAQVRLVVHGRTIGSGRLVVIGGHLGLQISRISARHEPKS